MAYRVEISDGDRADLREEIRGALARSKELKQQYKKDGLTIVFSSFSGSPGKRDHIHITKGNGLYAVRKNGKVVLTADSLESCARQAYVKGYIGYFQYIETAYGAEAEQKARNDPKIRARLKKAGSAANAY